MITSIKQLDNDDDSDSTFDQADFQNSCRQELDAFMAALEARGGYPACEAMLHRY